MLAGIDGLLLQELAKPNKVRSWRGSMQVFAAGLTSVKSCEGNKRSEVKTHS